MPLQVTPKVGGHATVPKAMGSPALPPNPGIFLQLGLLLAVAGVARLLSLSGFDKPDVILPFHSLSDANCFPQRKVLHYTIT